MPKTYSINQLPGEPYRNAIGTEMEHIRRTGDVYYAWHYARYPGGVPDNGVAVNWRKPSGDSVVFTSGVSSALSYQDSWDPGKHTFEYLLDGDSVPIHVLTVDVS